MRSEREKKILLMRISVITIIVLIFFLWVFNMRNIWKPITLSDESKTQNQDLDLANFKKDINKQMTEINKKLSDINDKKKEVNNKAGEELLNNIIKDAGSATSSPANSSTSTSTPSSPILKNNNCPAYINCMPTIGEARSCQVPP